MCPCRSNLSFLFLFFLLISETTAGQSTVQAIKEFEKLAKAYHSNRISADKYLDRTYSLTQQLVSEGTEFKTQELVGLLSLYKDIAWGKKEYGRPRIKHYTALVDNAEIFGQTGEAMYEQGLYSKVISTYKDKKFFR